MYQNKTRNRGNVRSQKKDVKLYNIEEIKILMKKFFEKRNLLLYIISFMISMVSFGGNSSLGLAPFALAIVAATLANEIPIGVVYVLTCIGTYLGFGTEGLATYIITSLVFFGSLFILKTRIQDENNEKRKIGKHIIISILCVQILPMIFKEFYLYNAFVAIVQAILTYAFYKVFVNSITVIRDYGVKKVFSIEEIIGASMMIIISFVALTPVHILGFSLKNILSILIVLILGWKNGILVGTTGGVTAGVVLGVVDSGDPIMIAVFALSGLLSGILNKYGKLGVIVGFILGNLILTFVDNGNLFPIIHFQEILIAALGLLLIPKKVEFAIEDLFVESKLLPETTGRVLESSKETIKKLTNISETISKIAKNYTEEKEELVDTEISQIEKENEDIFINELQLNITDLEDNVLYDDICYSKEIVSDIFKVLLANNKIEEEQLIKIFENHNNYIIGVNNENEDENSGIKEDLSEMITRINSIFKESKVKFVCKKKIEENKKNVSAQLQGVSEIIAEVAENIDEIDDTKYNKEEKQILQLLRQKQIKIEDISVKKEETGRCKIIIYTKCCSSLETDTCYLKNIEQIISRVLNEKINLTDQECGLRKKEKYCKFTYISSDKYSLQIGIAKATKDGSKVSGDTSIQTRLEDGKYLLAISDGKGSGEEAKKSSKMATDMLEELLTSGFKHNTSIKLINSTLAGVMQEDMFATLDITILDLYAENMEFIKNGACPSYVKSGKNVQILKSDSMPTGILNNIDLVIYDKDIRKNDIIVMCSDGITDSDKNYQNKELWLKYLLEEINTDDVQKIADVIISEAIDNDYGIEKDDMTVIVAKVC